LGVGASENLNAKEKQGEGEWALSGHEPDQTGENLTAEGAGAGTRRVKPKETDKRPVAEKCSLEG
jgi:hypothetical protein